MKKKNGIDGFSLIELLVVVSIIAVVVTLSMSFTRKFQIAAKMSEAKINVRTASTMLKSYIDIEEKSSGGLLVSNNRSTSTSCNVANPIGFSITDCKRLNYVYFSSGSVGGSSIVHAFEGWESLSSGTETVIFHSLSCHNVWVAKNGELSTNLEAENCNGGYQLWRSFYGTAGPEGDYNASGNVDLADYTIWRDMLGSFSVFP